MLAEMIAERDALNIAIAALTRLAPEQEVAVRTVRKVKTKKVKKPPVRTRKPMSAKTRALMRRNLKERWAKARAAGASKLGQPAPSSEPVQDTSLDTNASDVK